MTRASFLALSFVAPCVGACAAPDALRATPEAPARREVVADFEALLPPPEGAAAPPAAGPGVRLERVSAGVPWPRGLAWVDGELVVLARGRHRSAGGVDHAIDDRTGCLFRVDPGVSEPVVAGVLASPAVAANATLLAEADGDPFRLPDPAREPIDDARMDRPYCTLVYDRASDNFFVCGYSGVDLAGKRFRKNATDSIVRFDMRTLRWYPVERHDPRVVPEDELGDVVSNAHYPHHDPERNPPPHGWLNGPDGACVSGDFVYAVSKDNHRVVAYDLRGIRSRPDAGYPESRPVLGPCVVVSSPAGTRETQMLGPSAAAVHGEHLYVGYRTSSVVLRFALEPGGGLKRPVVGELVAVFEPWDAEARRSADLIDIAFDSGGRLFVSCARDGKVWDAGVPDPRRPFFGDERSERPTSAPPRVDLRRLTGRATRCGNLLFDDRDRLYLCTDAADTGSATSAGAIYRVVGA